MADSSQPQQNQSCRQYRLSVIIVSWNVQEDLRKCLQSVLEGNAEEGLQVWVVDNASTDDTVAMLRQEFPLVKLICNETNAGFAAANNQGLKAAHADYYLLLNPDTVVPEGAFAKLLQFADAQPRAGAIGPKLVNPDGGLQHSARRFPTINAAMFRNTALGGLFPGAASPGYYLMMEWDHNDAREVDWVSGACMLLRREALEEVGYLDESFFWGSEDVDYCFRLHQAGWLVMYSPEPVIVHAIGKSTSQVVIPTIIRTHRSMRRLYSKHLARNFLSRALVAVGVWLRAGLLIASYLTRQLLARLRRLFRKR